MLALALLTILAVPAEPVAVPAGATAPFTALQDGAIGVVVGGVAATIGAIAFANPDDALTPYLALLPKIFRDSTINDVLVGALAGASIGGAIGVLLGELRSAHPVNLVWAVPTTLVGGFVLGALLQLGGLWLLTSVVTTAGAISSPTQASALAVLCALLAGGGVILSAAVVGPSVALALGTALDEDDHRFTISGPLTVH